MDITIAIAEGKTIAKATAEGKIVAKAIAEDRIIGQFYVTNFERPYLLNNCDSLCFTLLEYNIYMTSSADSR